MVRQVYLTKRQLNIANSCDDQALYMNFDMSITNDKVLSEILYRWDDFKYEIFIFSFSNSYGVYV